MEIPEISKDEYEELSLENATRATQLNSLKSIQAPLKNTKPVNFKSNEAVTVLQHEYAVANADSNQHILGNYVAGQCIILALYDHKNKKAVLAHIDALTELNSLHSLLNLVSSENTVAHLAGGTSHTQEQCIKIIEFLNDNNIKIVNAALVRQSFEPASLAIDSRTGTIYSPVEYYQLDQTPDIDFRINKAGFQWEPTPLTCYENKSSEINPVQNTVEKIKFSPRFNFDSNSSDRNLHVENNASFSFKNTIG